MKDDELVRAEQAAIMACATEALKSKINSTEKESRV